MTNSISLIAPAKLNLNLFVKDKLENGYHSLESDICFLNMHDKIKYIFVETHERFSHKLGLETAKLKLRIKNLNINNINLDWV